MLARRLALVGITLVAIDMSTDPRAMAQASPARATPPWKPLPAQELVPRITDTIAVGGPMGAPIVSSVAGRLYYNAGDKLWLYDRTTRRATVITDGGGNVDLSPKNDRITFHRRDQSVGLGIVYTVPLDPRTGDATGPARRVALSHGDQPRFSPDGKWIAFSAYDSAAATPSRPQHIAVVPADGGSERAVTGSFSGIGTIRWSPDGRTLYFAGLGPDRRPLWTIYHVSASGGKAEPILQTGWRFHVSPSGNGLLVMAAATELFAVSSPTSAPLALVRIPQPFVPTAWIKDNVVVVSGQVTPAAVRSLSLDRGSSREILASRNDVEELFWAPDGARFATLGHDLANTVVHVVNADGSGRRQLGAGSPLRGQNLVWSPDGKFIVVNGPERTPFNVIDVASGSVKRLGYSFINGKLQWRNDSRAVLYTTRLGPADVVSLREVTLDGKERTLAEMPVDILRLELANDSVGVVSKDSGIVRISLANGARTIVVPIREFSEVQWDRTGTRLAIRREGNSGDGKANEIEVFSASGKREAVLPLPCGRAPWLPSRGMFFHPDGKQLIVACGPNGRSAIYAVPISGGEPRKVGDIPTGGSSSYLALSPDGKQLLYTVSGAPMMLVGEVSLPPIPRP